MTALRWVHTMLIMCCLTSLAMVAGSQPPAPPPPEAFPADTPPPDFRPPWDEPFAQRPPWAPAPGPMRPLDSPDALEAFLGRLDQARNRFDQVESERMRLLDDLARLRHGYRPDDLAPPALIRRQNIERLLAEVTARVEEGNHLARQAAFMTGRLLRDRARWQPLLEKGQGLSEANAGRLREALTGLDRESVPVFCRSLLGDNLGILVADTLASIPPPFLNPSDRATTATVHPPQIPGWRWGNGRHPGPLPGGMRRRLQERLERIERRQEEMSASLAQQEAEIQRLRMILDYLPPEPPDASEQGQ